MKRKKCILIICSALLLVCLAVYYFTWPVYPDFKKDIKSLDKQNTNFAYIDENQLNYSEIFYKEILDGRSLSSSSDGSYELSFKYNKDNNNYLIEICVVGDKNDFKNDLFTNTYKNSNYYLETHQSKVAKWLTCYSQIGEYIYSVSCIFDIDRLNDNEKKN